MEVTYNYKNHYIMVFWALVLVSCPFCVQALLIFQSIIFSVISKIVRIERQMIKHTFLFCFLHCVNIICISITKRDPNNLTLSVFSSLGMCFNGKYFSVWKMPYNYCTASLQPVSILGISVYQLSVYSCKVFMNSFFPLLEDFIKELKKTYCNRK